MGTLYYCGLRIVLDCTQLLYRLGNGVKFYMLEVEDYVPPVPSQRRTVSAAIHRLR